MTPENSYAFREPVGSDVPFVMATWLKHYREQQLNKLIPRAMYFPQEKLRIERLLSHANVTIVCNREDPNQIFSWVAWSKVRDIFIIHYCYTRKRFRGLGIMRAAIESLHPDVKREEIACTRLSKEVLLMGLKDAYRVKYNPYLEELVQ